MIWLLNHETEKLEEMSFLEFIRRFNEEENFSNLYTIQTMNLDSDDEHDDRDYDAEDEALYGNPTEPPTSGQSQWWIDPETGEPRYG